VYGYKHLGKSDLKNLNGDLMNFELAPATSKKKLFKVKGNITDIPTKGAYEPYGNNVVKKIGSRECKRLRKLARRM